MRAQVTANAYLDQIRFRIQRREQQFVSVVNQFASGAGVTGQTGAMVKKTFDALQSEFDAIIQELLTYLGQTTAKAPDFEDEGYQLTAQSLEGAAATFKALVNLDRLKRMSRGLDTRIERLAGEAFGALDELLRLRLSEFRMGLHAASPSTPRVPASNRYVALNDNQRTETQIDLRELHRVVSMQNEPVEEDRLIALSEIAAFEQTILQPRVSTELIQRFVDRVLKWMMTVFTGAVFAEVAQRLIHALLPLLA